MQRRALGLAILIASLPLVGADGPQPVPGAKQASKKKTSKKAAEPAPKGPDMITTPSGLKYVDTVVGTGDTPQKGQKCLVHYTGWLDNGKGERGKKFDSSVDRGEPLPIPIGVGRVIKGWDEGVISMKVGGKRTLYIPAPLGYGARGAGGDIPPNANLIFDVELISIK
ncbi:FKBP-type peptidyl-prolyl cis-trans isomerase [Geothrix sp. PMB-07]|uniref:FKBP-type peptidyl-prolyl cis-trans isomerase n=1 Tax=Geothrix sp. PMB-07 TaxID=3068640 RepID=UPI00274118BC|nr:FKBP-type peptidyl-prolyl cis-trans isomerase [Geothrix sp. PMB-07]WLT32126.1 FKBP-type peptidyl-prolyl cis-trans isomerase [Geothrix sp. PMB-07]